jgi:hypothetical protein
MIGDDNPELQKQFPQANAARRFDLGLAGRIGLTAKPLRHNERFTQTSSDSKCCKTVKACLSVVPPLIKH